MRTCHKSKVTYPSQTKTYGKTFYLTNKGNKNEISYDMDGMIRTHN